MDPRLDELIESAASPVAPRTPDLQHTLRSLVAETEALTVSSQPRLGRRIAVAGLAVAGAVGIGAAAATAAGLFEPKLSPTGERHVELALSKGVCDVTYKLDFQREPAWVAGIGAAQWTETVQAAEQYVHDFDFTTISINDAIEKSLKADALYRSSSEYLALPAKERPPVESRDSITLGAVGSELLEQTRSELTRLGLPAKAVSMSSANRCDTDGSGQ